MADMTRGKTITMYLIDGDTTARIKCSLTNWTGIAYKIPRIMLDKCKDGNGDIIKHLKQTGIYFLFGENEESEKAIYIGQAVGRKNGEGLLNRLQEHNKNKKPDDKKFDEWTEAIVFTTQNDSYGPTEISYLENKFRNLAKDADRYKVINKNEPNPGNVTEEKESELLEFIDYVKIIVGVLGHKVFEQLAKRDSQDKIDTTTENRVFYFKEAQCIMSNEGYVLLKDSKIDSTIKPSAPNAVKKAREKNAEKIKDGFTTKDILFNSASGAATFICGYAVNGKEVWKTSDGKSLQEFI